MKLLLQRIASGGVLLVALGLQACGSAMVGPSAMPETVRTAPSPTATPPEDVQATYRAENATNVAGYGVTQTARGEIRTAGAATQSWRVIGTHTAEAASTLTIAPTATAWANATATQAAEAPATVQAVLAAPASASPLHWPMPPFTDAQVAEARACDIAGLYEDRYQDTSAEELVGAYPLVTPCDWAVLAAAYGYRAYNEETEEVEPLPPDAYQAYHYAIQQNPALLMRNWIVYGYFGDGSLVDAPPVTQQPVVSALLKFTFGGIGYQSDVTVIITEANTPSPSVSGRILEFNQSGVEGGPYDSDRHLSGTIDPALVQALGGSLTDLVPIQGQFDAIGCYDYYPDWKILLTYEDGTVISVATNGTNFLAGGGPWQTNIDGQDYLQYSFAIPEALGRIAEALQIPSGTTAGMACGPGAELIDLAYPVL